MKKSLIRNICLAIMLTTAVVENTFGADGVDQLSMEQRQLELNNNLFEAIRTRNYPAVESSLENGANINHANNKGWTPLHTALRFFNQKIVLCLLERGPQLNSQDEDDNTPLHLAAYLGPIPNMELLLSSGAFINSQGQEGRTPLNIAALCDDSDRVELLLKRGADSRIRDNNGLRASDYADDRMIKDLLIRHERMRDRVTERAIGLFLGSNEIDGLHEEAFRLSNPETKEKHIPNILYVVGDDVARMVVELL